MIIETHLTILSPLNDLAEQIKAEYVRDEREGDFSIEAAVNAGWLLSKAWALCPHDEWGDWLQTYCGFSEDTAQDYLCLACVWLEGFMKHVPNADDVQSLRATYDDILRAISDDEQSG